MEKEENKSLTSEINEISQKFNLEIKSEKLQNEINSLHKTKKIGVPYFLNIKHFCDVTNFSQNQILLFLNSIDKAYTTFKIPKRSKGERIINAPSKKLKKIQRWILDNILYKIEPGKYAYGFLPNKSINDNASLHVNQDLICGIDIEDYFPSITSNRVWGFFRSLGYNELMASNLTKLTTYQGSIPQGAPTSPMIANLISWRMDKRIGTFCQKRGLKYSRYADDITISGNKELPRYTNIIFKIIESEGFNINKDKFRISGRGSAQKVTGIIVNDKLSIGRRKKRRLRAIVNNILNNGPIIENRDDDPFFKEKLFGELSFAKMIDPAFAEPLLKKLKKIKWDEFKKYYSDFSKDEEIRRDIIKSTKNLFIDFTELGFFQKVPNLPKISKDEFNELIKELKSLREKCKEHSKENCQNCLLKPNQKEHQKCLKYILGQYIKSSGGHHHGHEIYDISGETKLFKELVFVLFLLKRSGLSKQETDRLFIQFYDCFEIDEANVISIVVPDNLDHKPELRIRRKTNESQNEKYVCLILRKEMLRIYYDYKNRILNEK